LGQSITTVASAQLKHGLYTAYSEGLAERNALLSGSPAVPVALTWVNDANPTQVYGSGIAGSDPNRTLLDALVGAGTRAQYDLRHSSPAHNENKEQYRAVVSLLRDFEDITTNPEWTPGVHGLWYTVQDDLRVFLPSSIEQLVREAESSTEHTSRILRLLASKESSRITDVGADENHSEVFSASLPAGASLFRFTAKEFTYSVQEFPKMVKRMPHKDNLKSMAVSQADRRAVTSIDMAATISHNGSGTLRGLVLPPAGAYHNLHHHFHRLRENVIAFHGPVEHVQRVFVLASAWDSYVDGCALIERRCAWYGGMNLDLWEMERLRKTGHFSEVTMEQDTTERSIEALLPILTAYLGPDHDFTLVPILVGGVSASRVQDFIDLLAPCAEDSRNLFLVAGDCEQLQRDMEEETDKDMLAYSCSPHLVDALELYFATLAHVEDSEVDIEWFTASPDAESLP